jgi:FkbM family methyltransferase
MFWFTLARMYSKVYGLCHDVLGFNVRGMGFFIAQIKTDRPLKVKGCQLYFNHKISSCYLRSIDGKWNEPETHIFLRNIIQNTPAKIAFVDVGANIGEMIIDVGQYPNVTHCIGFEPNPECVFACKKAMALNGYTHIEIIQKAVAADSGGAQFNISEKAPTTSSLIENTNQIGVTVEVTTLDAESRKFSGATIMLIDVEGAELLVMKGGKNYIASQKPLIIFEYHEGTRKRFSLEEVRSVLGPEYQIHRLRHDGALDSNLHSTWNCVAVHSDSIFHLACRSLLVS